MIIYDTQPAVLLSHKKVHRTQMTDIVATAAVAAVAASISHQLYANIVVVIIIIINNRIIL